jgi:hypothetical protein
MATVSSCREPWGILYSKAVIECSGSREEKAVAAHRGYALAFGSATVFAASSGFAQDRL